VLKYYDVRSIPSCPLNKETVMAVILRRSTQSFLSFKNDSQCFRMSNAFYDAVVDAIEEKLTRTILRRITVRLLKSLVDVAAGVEEQKWNEGGFRAENNPGLILVARKAVVLSPIIGLVVEASGLVEANIMFPFYGSVGSVQMVLGAVVDHLKLDQLVKSRGGRLVRRTNPITEKSSGLSTTVLVRGDELPVWVDFAKQKPPNWNSGCWQLGGFITLDESHQAELPQMWS